MSDNKKTITINADFFKMGTKSRRQTKKRREEGDSSGIPKIKIRNPAEKDVSTKTLKRRAVINMLKNNIERRKKLLVEGEEPMTNTTTYEGKFESDFKEAKSFLEKIMDQEAQKKQVSHSETLKNREPPIAPNSLLFNRDVFDTALSDISLQIEPPPQPLNANPANQNLGKMTIPPPPKYGCLKGGKLPTYRTMRSREQPTANAPPIGALASHPGSAVPSSPLKQTYVIPPATSSPVSDSTSISGIGKPSGLAQPSGLGKLTPAQQRSELKQFLDKKKEESQRIDRVQKHQQIVRPEKKKQRRTVRRTYRVGKSKIYPKVGVLISNRTIRTQVLQKKQEISETPIEDVRKYLVRQGFIRVGSSCPNDVLRKMYESAILIGGDIKNHNPDNLVYNYMQGQ